MPSSLPEWQEYNNSTLRVSNAAIVRGISGSIVAFMAHEVHIKEATLTPEDDRPPIEIAYGIRSY